MNDAVTGPPPGTRPKKNPSPLPRSIGRHDARQSASVGHRPRMRSVTPVFLTILSTLLRTSGQPISQMSTANRSWTEGTLSAGTDRPLTEKHATRTVAATGYQNDSRVQPYM